MNKRLLIGISGSANILSKELMIVTATGFITLLPLSIALTMIMCKTSKWLGKDTVQGTGPEKHG